MFAQVLIENTRGVSGRVVGEITKRRVNANTGSSVDGHIEQGPGEKDCQYQVEWSCSLAKSRLPLIMPYPAAEGLEATFLIVKVPRFTVADWKLSN